MLIYFLSKSKNTKLRRYPLEVSNNQFKDFHVIFSWGHKESDMTEWLSTTHEALKDKSSKDNYRYNKGYTR